MLSTLLLKAFLDIVYLVSFSEIKTVILSDEGYYLDHDYSLFYEQLEAYSRSENQGAAYSDSAKDDNPLTLSEDQLAALQSDLSALDEQKYPQNE